MLFSRSHAPHGNAVLDASHPVCSLCITDISGLQRRQGWVPMQRMGTRTLLKLMTLSST